ncbi:MAG: 3-deoxy-manno-octulosonate cytidylyltransferase [Candidatus Omnitrophota bacterium]|nr:3-deoxy-manno-octulosonate cytidylyltransferase [Candidatus Omnitrophota bacterium]
MSVLVVIPARYGSVRFPGKPLALLQGKPVIQHVYERAVQAARMDDVVVATDDERIRDAVQRAGGKAVMTSPDARSGTERAAEVAQTHAAQVILNVQGDEPLIHPEQLDQVAEFLLAHRAIPMATLMTRLTRREELANPNVVKVVVDQDGYALYFSRSPIPFIKSEGGGSRVEGHPSPYWKHIGLYGYQRQLLLRFPHLEPTPLEQLEQLEQLRALEHGYQIRVLETAHDTIGVDTPDDLQRVEALLTGNVSP